MSVGHHQRFTVHRVLRHGALARRARRQRGEHLEALALVKILLGADPQHGTGIGTIRGLGERGLVDDRRAVDQPADRADIRPAERGVVEDARVLRGAGEQLSDHLLARRPQRLGGPVEVQAVTGLVLHLGEEPPLAPQTRCARDPIAFGQHADHLGVRVLGDHAQELLSIALRHPVAGLDRLVGLEPALEVAFEIGRVVRWPFHGCPPSETCYKYLDKMSMICVISCLR
jgi:hypothetical protein